MRRQSPWARRARGRHHRCGCARRSFASAQWLSHNKLARGGHSPAGRLSLPQHRPCMPLRPLAQATFYCACRRRLRRARRPLRPLHPSRAPSPPPRLPPPPHLRPPLPRLPSARARLSSTSPSLPRHQPLARHCKGHYGNSWCSARPGTFRLVTEARPYARAPLLQLVRRTRYWRGSGTMVANAARRKPPPARGEADRWQPKRLRGLCLLLSLRQFGADARSSAAWLCVEHARMAAKTLLCHATSRVAGEGGYALPISSESRAVCEGSNYIRRKGTNHAVGNQPPCTTSGGGHALVHGAEAMGCLDNLEAFGAVEWVFPSTPALEIGPADEGVGMVPYVSQAGRGYAERHTKERERERRNRDDRMRQAWRRWGTGGCARRFSSKLGTREKHTVLRARMRGRSGGEEGPGARKVVREGLAADPLPTSTLSSAGGTAARAWRTSSTEAGCPVATPVTMTPSAQKKWAAWATAITKRAHRFALWVWCACLVTA